MEHQINSICSSSEYYDVHGKIRVDSAKKYLKTSHDLLMYLMVLIHLGSGGPARASELVRFAITNTRGRCRDLFWVDNCFVWIQTYSKTYSVTQNDSFQVRMTHASISKLLFRYLLFVRPLAGALSIELSRVDSLCMPDEDPLILDNGEIFEDEDYFDDDDLNPSVASDHSIIKQGGSYLCFSYLKRRKVKDGEFRTFFSKVFSDNGLELNFSTYRQIIQTWFDPVRIPDIKKLYTPPLENLFYALNSQMGHSIETGMKNYNRSDQDFLDPGLFERMRYIYN